VDYYFNEFQQRDVKQYYYLFLANRKWIAKAYDSLGGPSWQASLDRVMILFF
jgi:hypothetical protein